MVKNMVEYIIPLILMLVLGVTPLRRKIVDDPEP